MHIMLCDCNYYSYKTNEQNNCYFLHWWYCYESVTASIPLSLQISLSMSEWSYTWMIINAWSHCIHSNQDPNETPRSNKTLLKFGNTFIMISTNDYLRFNNRWITVENIESIIIVCAVMVLLMTAARNNRSFTQNITGIFSNWSNITICVALIKFIYHIPWPFVWENKLKCMYQIFGHKQCCYNKNDHRWILF